MQNYTQQSRNYEINAEPKSPKGLSLAQEQKTSVVPIKAGFTQFEVINAIYDSKLLSEVKLTAGARLVLISLARHYNPSNDEFFPSYSCISSHTGVSKKSVERAIKELVNAGLITYRTEKVNRYRFTGRFFACVKMTPTQRQNDASDYGQNDVQTNKEEKRMNNKEKVLNFSSLSAPKMGKNEQGEKSSPKTNTSIINEGSTWDKNTSSKFMTRGENPAPCGQNDASFAQTNAQKAYWARSNWQSRSTPTFNVPPAQRNGGSSFTPSVSKTDEYLKTIREARCAACSPLDFDEESAKRWYNSLSAPLRSTSLAKRVAQKYPELLH